MRKTTINDLPVYQFHLLERFSDSVGHAVLSREGGVSKKPFDSLNVRYGIGDKLLNVKKNRALVCKALGIEPQNLISAEQTHSKNVQVVDEEFLKNKTPGECYGVDAFVSNVPGAALMIQVADCQVQLMYDPKRQVVAAVHAGWKGLALNISAETIKVMKSKSSQNRAAGLFGFFIVKLIPAFFQYWKKGLKEIHVRVLLPQSIQNRVIDSMCLNSFQ